MASGTYRETLTQPGLRPFLLTQFLGAFNDNVCKIIVTFPAIKAYGPALGPALIAVAFILPFMLFSGYAGHWADATSKRKVLIATKACEMVVMLLMVPVLMLAREGVMWPLIAPGAAIALALVFVMNFGVFPSAVLVGQPAGDTRTIAIAAYQQAFEHYDMSMASAIAVIMGLCQLLGLAIVVGLRGRLTATDVATLGAGKR